MNMPGFTAEASLYNVSTRYRATAEATVYGGIVRPAGSGLLSDPYGSSVPFLSTQLFFPDRPIVPYRLCWRYGCRWVDLSPGLPFPPHIVQRCGFEWVC
jgi:hypothetical protein